MPTGPRVLIDNACYHITARGNQKQATFVTKSDYEELLHRIDHYKHKHAVRLYAYCLMPNHLHFVLRPAISRNLSKFMHGLLRSYTKFFNEKYDKVGHLWQGRFKSKIIDNIEYMHDASAYIENNPVRAGMVEKALDYQWSSCQERLLFGWNKKRLIDDFSS